MVYSEVMENQTNANPAEVTRKFSEFQTQQAGLVKKSLNALSEEAHPGSTTQGSTPLVDDLFGGSLKYWREMRNLTQEAVTAEMVKRGFDFHQSTLYKIESGKRRVLLGEGMALAEILEVPLSRLTEPEVNSEPSLLASLKFGAKLEIDAIYKALTGLSDVFLAATVLGQTVSLLEEVSGDKEFEFSGVTATARDFYEPLIYSGVKPAIEELEKLLANSQAVLNYLK